MRRSLGEHIDPPAAAGGYGRDVFGLCKAFTDDSISGADIYMESNAISANRERLCKEDG